MESHGLAGRVAGWILSCFASETGFELEIDNLRFSWKTNPIIPYLYPVDYKDMEKSPLKYRSTDWF